MQKFVETNYIKQSRNLGVNMRKYQILFWVTTTLIFLFEGVMPALTSTSEMAKQGIAHLGYPEYFGYALAAFKVCGSIVLIIPQFPARLREWAYAGFGFDFIFAFISLTAVDGLTSMGIAPVIAMLILVGSYVGWVKTKKA